MRKYILMFIICVSSFMIYTNNVKADSYGTYNFGYRHTVTCPNCNNFSLGSNNANAFFTLPSSAHTTVTKSIYSDTTSKLTGDSFLVTVGFIKPSNEYVYSCSAAANNTWDGYTYYADGTSSYYTGTGSADCTAYQFNEKTSQFTLLLKYGSHDFSGTVACNLTASSENGLVYQCPRFQEEQDVSRLDFVFNYFIDNGYIDFDINLNFTTIVSSVNEINKNTQEIKDKINDSSIDNNNATGTINGLSNQLASDNTITSLLLLPVNFINVLIDGLSGQCVPYSLGELWGSEIVLPCVNLYNTFGAIWYMVDTGLSALVIFKMSKYFIRLFNKLTNLKDGGLEEAYS